MRNCSCSCSCSCTFISVLISLIAGAVVGALFYFGLIPALITAPISFIITAAFGIVTGAALVTGLLLLRDTDAADCLCRLRRPLLAGVIGTFLASLVALSITLAAESVFSAIIVGLTVFFLILTIAIILCLISCASECDL